MALRKIRITEILLSKQNLLNRIILLLCAVSTLLSASGSAHISLKNIKFISAILKAVRKGVKNAKMKWVQKNNIKSGASRAPDIIHIFNGLLI